MDGLVWDYYNRYLNYVASCCGLPLREFMCDAIRDTIELRKKENRMPDDELQCIVFNRVAELQSGSIWT